MIESEHLHVGACHYMVSDFYARKFLARPQYVVMVNCAVFTDKYSLGISEENCRPYPGTFADMRQTKSFDMIDSVVCKQVKQFLDTRQRKSISENLPTIL